MRDKDTPGILEQTRVPFRQFATREDLLHVDVTVLAKPLTPEEAIGHPGRRDFPIVIGKERVLEASIRESRGHAYTDSPREFLGTLEDVLTLELSSNQSRAIYVATLNAVMNHLGMVDKTVHCRDEDPEECALEIARNLSETYGQTDVGLIGLNPAIAERLIDTFGADHVRITDLSADNIGQRRFGVEIWDGGKRTDELIDASHVIVVTGTTLVNGTFDHIMNRIRTQDKEYIIYGVTAAGVCRLSGLRRICPKGRN